MNMTEEEVTKLIEAAFEEDDERDEADQGDRDRSTLRAYAQR